MTKINEEVVGLDLAPDKAHFSTQNYDIFLISAQKHMLWVLIRSASVRHF